MSHAFILGATGQVGRATATALLADGWEVTVASRGGRSTTGMPAGARPVTVDRADTAALRAALGSGVDVLVDTVAFDAAHARQVAGLSDLVGSAVVISTGNVYASEDGRPFGADPFPRFPVPVPETQPTVDPSLGGYGGDKVAMERVLLAADLPVTLLRAAAIHGPHSTQPREWYFVKRALDGRPVRVLAFNGESRFHPTATTTLAELIRLAARRPGSRALNAADPDAPTVREIAAAVGDLLDHHPEEILVDGPPPGPTVGDTPWTTPEPFVLDMTAAGRELGYRPVTTYREALPAAVDWLLEQARRGGPGWDWRPTFPVLAKYPDLFDYAAEDAWLAGR